MLTELDGKPLENLSFGRIKGDVYLKLEFFDTRIVRCEQVKSSPGHSLTLRKSYIISNCISGTRAHRQFISKSVRQFLKFLLSILTHPGLITEIYGYSITSVRMDSRGASRCKSTSVRGLRQAAGELQGSSKISGMFSILGRCNISYIL